MSSSSLLNSMKQRTPRFVFLLCGFLCFCALVTEAQQNDKPLKVKPCLLKGKWQLVQTFSVGSLHQVKKEDYDGVICFRSFQRYYEEVNYESNHWIIAGKWHLNRKTRTLELTQRNYTVGKLEEHPRDVSLTIFQQDKGNWAGGDSDKGQPVKVFYTRIPKH